MSRISDNRVTVACKLYQFHCGKIATSHSPPHPKCHKDTKLGVKTQNQV